MSEVSIAGPFCFVYFQYVEGEVILDRSRRPGIRAWQLCRIGVHAFIEPVAALFHGLEPCVVYGEAILSEQRQPVSGESSQ